MKNGNDRPVTGELKPNEDAKATGGDSLSAPPSYYVGIGASAGGLEAIEALFKNMPPRSGMAFIVVQHLSPDYKSLMVELLSKRTEMQVSRADDGMIVQANHIYLIPPKKNLKIFHGKLLLSEQEHHKGINLPIDIFLRSLAEDQGDHAVAIILSGTGSDGMRGIRAVKESGGMVMVQSEESARFDGMPRSAISTGLPDFILPPEEMPKQLLSFIKHPYAHTADRPAALMNDDDDMTRIFALIREKTRADFTYYKPNTILRRLERRMNVNQMHDLREYVRYLESDSREVNRLYRELLIGVTNFFRDPEAFKLLGEKYIPEILENRAAQTVRCWVTGCSTGEEAYTLGILFHEAMERIGIHREIKIFATDIDRDAIQTASSGEYPESIAADIQKEYLARYFYRRGENFQVSRQLREMVVFAQHNLIRDPPFTNIDLLSCRNLLIYLQPEMQRKVLGLFNFALNPQSILMLGTSETTGDMNEYFETLHQKWKIYRCKGRRKPPDDRALQEVPIYDGSSIRKPMTASRRQILTAYQEDRVMERLLNALAGDYVPLAMVINQDMEILYVMGDAQPYFRLPSGKMENNVTRLASRELGIPLATGIQKVFKTGQEAAFSNIRIRSGDAQKSVKMRIKPMPAKKGQEAMVVVVLREAEETHTTPGGTVTDVYDMDKQAEQRIMDLEQELQFTKENLQATIEELETSNEELQATNEELLASNEELQSTNEELHSVNEELYTVNAEHQRKIIELTELNNDMTNLLNSTRIGTLFLDENLVIRKYTPEIDHIFRILDNDLGRPISHLSHHLEDCDLMAIIENAHKSHTPVEQEVQTQGEQYYLMRILPYEIAPDAYSGLVITFIAIDQIKKIQKELEAHQTLLKETAKLARVGSWEFDPMSGRYRWSDEVYRIFERRSGDPQPTMDEERDCYTSESARRLADAFDRLMRHGTPYDLVLNLRTHRGTRRWVHVIGNAHKDGGRVIKAYGAIQDITELKKAQTALEESEGKYRQLFDKMLNGFALHRIITDDDGRAIDYEFLKVNHAFEEMTGLPAEEIVGKKATAVLPGIASSEFDWIGRYGRVALGGDSARFESYSEDLGKWYSVSAYSPEKGRFVTIFEDVTERREAEARLKRIEWLLAPPEIDGEAGIHVQEYGDMVALNTHRLLLDTIGAEHLRDLTADLVEMLGTSAAVYETNGDYAFGIMSSGWCRALDSASRALCGTEDNREALSCGKWHCHESCWNGASVPAMKSRQPTDIACAGGIRIYAVPILARDRVVGAINFGYGDPPRDMEKIRAIADKYKVAPDEMLRQARAYESRPPFIIDVAKRRLRRIARWIGAMVTAKCRLTDLPDD